LCSNKLKKPDLPVEVTMFDDFPKDEFYFTKNDEVTDRYYGVFSKLKIYIENLDLPDIDGFRAHRILPTGKEELYYVKSFKFQRGMMEIPDCYLIELSQKAPNENSIGNNITITGSHSIQIGNNNEQKNINIALEGIKLLIKTLHEDQSISAEEKKKDLSTIEKLITNPTVAAILGGAASGLLGLIR